MKCELGSRSGCRLQKAERNFCLFVAPSSQKIQGQDEGWWEPKEVMGKSGLDVLARRDDGVVGEPK